MQYAVVKCAGPMFIFRSVPNGSLRQVVERQAAYRDTLIFDAIYFSLSSIIGIQLPR